MRDFGAVIRDLRKAQDVGLRETAGKVGISPTYLSRIERGKESPPRPEVIKALAKELAADVDMLFRLSSSTDPEMAHFLNIEPEAVKLLRFLKEASFNRAQLAELIEAAKTIHSSSK